MSLEISIATVPMLSDNYCWILHQDQYAAAIDPGDAEPVLRFLSKNKLKLTHILCTHHHKDHCGGVIELKQNFNPVVIGPADLRMPFVTQRVSEGAECNVLSETATVIATPGHTATHVVYYFPKVRAIFTGDTLFSCGCGRLFEGTPAEMLQSLIKCAFLEDVTAVYCGHEYTEENLLFATTVDPNNKEIWQRLADVKYLTRRGLPTVPSNIGLEKSINPFLRTGSPEIRKKLGMEKASAIEVFAELRKRRDRF